MINVYCASAGSGKTHLLTGYYLTLLLRQDWTPEESSDHPTEYDEVLAVTFTNKATAEMKERIVAELDVLANQPQKSDYLSQILSPGETAEHLQKRAQTLLEKILCDYSNFNVTTIDRFFQKVIRAFMRELDLPSGYEIQLDEGVVLDAAVGRFLNSLGSSEGADKGEDYEWVRNFSHNHIQEGYEWDVQKKIRELANQLTSEEYERHRDSIQVLTQNKELLYAYRKQLSEIRTAFEKELKELGEAFCTWANTNIAEGGINGFKGGSRSNMRIFLDWAEGKVKLYSDTLIPVLEDASLCLKKGQSLDADQTEQLQEYLRRVKELFGEPYRRYNSAMEILSQLYQLGTLANVDEAVHQYCTDQSMVLIGNTNALLARLVGGGDSPFVYAKVGTRLRSFMIDEFQDTSGMQWNNFRPLLEESNAVGQRNLIVGDVKQSIYRFRGSDWSLLQSGLYRAFPDHHKNVTIDPEQHLASLILDTEQLRTNWRSLKSLVWFNNHFFEKAAEQMAWNIGHRLPKDAGKKKGTPVEYSEEPQAARMAKTIRDIYADVAQKYKPTKDEQPLAPGLVEVKFLTPRENEEEKESYNECAARQVPDVVRRLKEGGFRLKDIVVLGRKNAECQMVAEQLLAAGYPIISSKALRLDSNDAVRAIIAIMRHLQHPYDRLLRAIAGFELAAVANREGDMGDIVNAYFEQLKADQQEEQATYLFPTLAELANKPLYELLEGLIDLLPVQVQQGDSAFLLSLRDQAIQFIAQRSPDLSAFLEWWDESGCSTNIATPEGEDAISIMTIHQSKGLGMPAVIIPFATGSLDFEHLENGERSHPSILWCKPKDPALKVHAMEEAGLETPAFPISRNKELKDTDFAEEYFQERLCSIIDELNTAYVAYTRAKEALIIMTRATSTDDRLIYSQEKVLEMFREGLANQVTGPDFAAEVTEERITLGSWQRTQRGGQNDGSAISDSTSDGNASDNNDVPANMDAPASNETELQGSVQLPRLSMRQSKLKSSSAAIQRGNEMHERLEQIISLADVPADEEELRQLIQTNALTESWFAEGLTVYNEQPIVLRSGIAKRPDRIVVDAAGRCTVIDYKTSLLEEGQTHKPEHVRQVRIYMQLLKRMFPVVKGYLWYLTMRTTYEVTAEEE